MSKYPLLRLYPLDKKQYNKILALERQQADDGHGRHEDKPIICRQCGYVFGLGDLLVSKKGSRGKGRKGGVSSYARAKRYCVSCGRLIFGDKEIERLMPRLEGEALVEAEILVYL